jgi:hypothetical protein
MVQQKNRSEGKGTAKQMSDQRIGVLSVDDHPLLRQGIGAMINSQPDMRLVAEAANGALALCPGREPSR